MSTDVLSLNVLYFLFIVLGSVDCSTQFPISNEIDDPDYRLPNHTRPKSYSITIETGIANNDTNFKGRVMIDLKVSSETSSLKFHMKELTINKRDTVLLDERSKRYFPKEHAIERETDAIELIFDQILHTGDYKLNLTYSGNLKNDSDRIGFYKSFYSDENNVTRLLATTKFEPARARYAFPCWDEPEYRAIFNITLKYGKNYHAISNMPIKEETVDGDWKTTEFQSTPPMSTYLVAFVVSDFANVTNEFGNFTVWTPKYLTHKAPYARDIGMKILRTLENYTGIPFALPKMDQIAIPHFISGAMENWGLVTYRESTLLYENNVTSWEHKFYTTYTIAHEFAHQWFGNLVGPEWWEWLWLNEGFATYFGFYILDKVEPTWKPMNMFVLDVLQRHAFPADVVPAASPMNHEVETEYQLRSVFDAISYRKAASVIRMMSFALSERVFQRGLRYYLNENAYKVANSDTLFKSLQKSVDENSSMFESGFDVKEYMDPWVKQGGFPMIQVDTNIENNTIIVTQKRFSFDESRDRQWYIPLNYVTSDDPDFDGGFPKKWLKPNETLAWKMDLNNSWIVFNPQRSGYYRVNYNLANWKLIIDQLNNRNHTILDELTRAELIDDSVNMAKAGKINYSIPLDLMNYLHKELDHSPWNVALDLLNYFQDMLLRSSQYEIFRKFVASKLEPYMDLLKYEVRIEDDHMTTRARPAAVELSCKVRTKSCQDLVEKNFQTWLENPSQPSIPVKLLNLTFCSVLRYANSTVWREIYDLSGNESTAYEREYIMDMLACSHSEVILMNYLKMNGSNFLRTAERIQKNSRLSSSVLIKYMLEYTELVLESCRSDESFEGIFSRIGADVKSLDDFVRLAILIEKLQKRGIPRSVTDAAYQHALGNMEWIHLNGRVVEDWLSTWNNF